MAYAILSLRTTPTLESAADLAARRTGGFLGASLRRHRTAAPDGREAWQSFAAEFQDLDDSLTRSVSLMVAGIETPETGREAVLERALSTALDGASDRVSSFAASIRGPTMAIYAFGVMLPLALVGMLPVVTTTGSGVPLVLLAGLYDVLIPLGLLGAAIWLVARRPAVSAPGGAFVDIAAESPLHVLASIGLGAAVVAWGLGHALLPAWSVPLVAAALAIGAPMVVAFAPLRERQETVSTLEDGLPDALSIVGQRLRTGVPLEEAIEAVGDRLTGPVGDMFDDASVVHRRLGVPVRAAFRGPHGPLQDLPSDRARTVVTLLATAGEEGAPAGDTLLSMAAYLEDLQRVEREARRELAQTTGTLWQTAIAFAPAIAGVTVALATGMDSVDAPGGPVHVADLGVVIGVYVLALAIVLPGLSVVLERGFDPVRIAYRVGLALCAGSLLYPFTFVAARTVVSV
ncbi:MAG: type II secretion system F family protein [Halodesulfurarchaeum sp.]